MKNQIITVSASAGAGKTYALAKRFIEILINESEPSQETFLRDIQAITFTNKAAFQMKERIIEFLKRLALDDFKNDDVKKDLLSSLQGTPEEIKKKASLAMDFIVKEYSFFQIRTIDSFINALLIGCALKLGLSSKFKIGDNASDYIEYGTDKFIDTSQADEAANKLLKQFLDQYIFIEAKNGWVPTRHMLSINRAIFNITNVFGHTFNKSIRSDEDIKKKKETIIKLIKGLCLIMPDGMNKTAAKGINKFSDKNDYYFNIEDVPRPFRKDEIPLNKHHLPSDELSEVWREIRKHLTELCEWEAAFRFNCYIDIYDRVYKHLREYADKEDVIFLEELNSKARSIFEGDDITVYELYYRMASGFKHFLIDEFQDTSRLQWTNINEMVKEALSTGGSLFYVGDPKQAIYRFRGGDLTLFKGAINDFTGHSHEERHLLTNYRSSRNIVEFNNNIFSQENIKRFLNEGFKIGEINLNENGKNEIIDLFKDSGQETRLGQEGGYLKVQALKSEKIEDRDEEIKTRLLDSISELCERFRKKDIAVLTRKNKEVELVTSWLVENDISAESEKTMNIREHFLIKEIIAFLTFLDYPVDNLAFSAFLMGDIFLKAAAMERKDISAFIFDLNKNKRRQDKGYLYTAFRKQYPDTWGNFIEPFFKRIGKEPLYEFITGIISKFKIADNFPGYESFFMRFLEFVKSSENEYGSVSAFLEYFEEAPAYSLYVNTKSSDSVKVLTTHQAKGLEFEAVIIPFMTLDIKPGFADQSSGKRGSGVKGVPFTVLEQAGKNGMISLKKEYAYFSDSLRRVYEEEYKKTLIDGLNAAYVCLTRGKKEIHCFIPRKSGNAVNLLRHLFPKTDEEIGVKATALKTVMPEESSNAPVHIEDGWINAIKNEFMDKKEIIERNEIAKGETYHHTLSFIKNLHGKNIEEEIENSVDYTFIEYKEHIKTSRDEYKKVIVHLVSDAKLKHIFCVPEGTVYTEKDIISRGQTKRIDRLIVGDKEVMIVDYKSHNNPAMKEVYNKQVADYMECVESIYPGKKIRGFILYIKERKLEEV